MLKDIKSKSLVIYTLGYVNSLFSMDYLGISVTIIFGGRLGFGGLNLDQGIECG